MKALTILIFVFIFRSVTYAQAPEIEWQRALGSSSVDGAMCIQQTKDGGYVMAGFSGDNDGDATINNGQDDFWIVKMNNDGTIAWQKSYGGSLSENATSIQQTADEGYIVAGFTSSWDFDVAGNHAFSIDFWVLKLDVSGTLQWQKTLGGSDTDKAYSIRQTTDGGYIVAGLPNSTDFDATGNHGYLDYLVVKLSETGSIEWKKSLGGTGNDQGYDVQQTSEGGYVVAGYSDSNDGNVSGNHGNDDYWVVKLNGAGDIEWQKSFGGTSADMAFSIQQTHDEGYVIGGASASNNVNVTGNHGSYDYWVVKIDQTGTLQWQKSLGGNLSDFSYSVRQTSEGGYVAAGYTNTSSSGDIAGNHASGDNWIVKLDSAGTLQWEKAFGASSFENSTRATVTDGGGYIVSSISFSNDLLGQHGIADAWIVKLAPDALATTAFDSDTLTVAPVPASEFLSLYFNGVIDTVTITDMTGKVISQQLENATRINIQSLASGMYFLKVISNAKSYQTKFIKQ